MILDKVDGTRNEFWRVITIVVLVFSTKLWQTVFRSGVKLCTGLVRSLCISECLEIINQLS